MPVTVLAAVVLRCKRSISSCLKRPLSALWLSLLLLFPLPSSWALNPDKALHQYRQDSWSTPDGLVQVSVQYITQDQQRFLWFGTQVGLTRFDGRRFKNFTADNFPGLADNYINFLLPLADDIWIATRGGLSRYRAGTFTKIGDQTELGNVSHLFVYQQRLYVASANGLLRLNPDAPDEREWLYKREADRVGIVDGQLAFGSGTQLLRLDEYDQAKLIATLPAALSWFSTDRDGHTWLGTHAGLLQWRDGGLRRPFTEPALNDRLIESVLQDRDNNLWVATQLGAYRINHDQIERLDQRHKRSLFEDHEGNLWIGSQTDGVTRLWNGYMTRLSVPEGLNEPLVWSLYQDPNNILWAMTEDGVYRQQGTRFVLQWPGDQLPHRKVLSAYQSQDGTFWVGTAQGLAAFQNQRRVYQTELRALDAARIYSFLERPEGLWIGTRTGLYRWQNGTLLVPDDFPEMPITAVRAMVGDQDSRFWLGTGSGLFSYSPSTGFQTAAVEQIQQSTIMSMHSDGPGRLWVGTQGKGLFRLHDGRWSNYIERSGLYSSTVFHVNRIGTDLWLSSHKGIYSIAEKQFDDLDAGTIATLTPRIFGASHHSDRAECNGGSNQSGLVDRAGRFLCPTIDGIVIIDPAQLMPPVSDVTLQITDWRYASSETEAGWPMLAGQLPAGVGNLEIDYAALSYREPSQTQYRYRLVGDSRDWVQAGNRATAYFHRLPPGNYTLEIDAITESGIKPQNTATLNFRVQPYYYQTWWFRGLVILLIASTLLALFVWRYRLLNARKEILEALVEKRTAELQLANEQLQRASRTDPLTQLGNRRYVVERIPQDIALARRSHLHRADAENRDIIFVMLDIDHFKQINDKYGHSAGDAVLSEVGQRITNSIRDSDYAVRWGGEEFLIVGRCADQTQSQNLPERLLHAISAHPIALDAQTELTVTCSIGFAHYPFLAGHVDAVSWEQIVAIADAALYLSKHGGRNQWTGIGATPAFMPTDLASLNGKLIQSELLTNGKLRTISSRASGYRGQAVTT